jgi:hypothetical protein
LYLRSAARVFSWSVPRRAAHWREGPKLTCRRLTQLQAVACDARAVMTMHNWNCIVKCSQVSDSDFSAFISTSGGEHGMQGESRCRTSEECDTRGGNEGRHRPSLECSAPCRQQWQSCQRARNGRREPATRALRSSGELHRCLCRFRHICVLALCSNTCNIVC